MYHQKLFYCTFINAYFSAFFKHNRIFIQTLFQRVNLPLAMVFEIAFAPIPFNRYNDKPVRRSRVVYKTLGVHIGTLRRLKENK